MNHISRTGTGAEVHCMYIMWTGVGTVMGCRISRTDTLTVVDSSVSYQ